MSYFPISELQPGDLILVQNQILEVKELQYEIDDPGIFTWDQDVTPYLVVIDDNNEEQYLKFQEKDSVQLLATKDEILHEPKLVEQFLEKRNITPTYLMPSKEYWPSGKKLAFIPPDLPAAWDFPKALQQVIPSEDRNLDRPRENFQMSTVPMDINSVMDDFPVNQVYPRDLILLNGNVWEVIQVENDLSYEENPSKDSRKTYLLAKDIKGNDQLFTFNYHDKIERIAIQTNKGEYHILDKDYQSLVKEFAKYKKIKPNDIKNDSESKIKKLYNEISGRHPDQNDADDKPNPQIEQVQKFLKSYPLGVPYTGAVDGKINPEILNSLSILESSLGPEFKNKLVSGSNIIFSGIPEAQEAIKNLKAKAPEIKNLEQDNIKAFQKFFGLQPSGIIDPQLISAAQATENKIAEALKDMTVKGMIWSPTERKFKTSPGDVASALKLIPSV